MTAILPDTDTPSKTLSCGSEGLPEENPGSIVFRFTSQGRSSVEIITDQSDVEDALRQRFAMARPMLEILREMFTMPPFSSQDSR